MEPEVQLDKVLERTKQGQALSQADVDLFLQLASSDSHALKIRLILSNTLSSTSKQLLSTSLTSHLTSNSSKRASAYHLVALLVPHHPEIISTNSFRSTLSKAFKASGSTKENLKLELDGLAHVAAALAPLPQLRPLLRESAVQTLDESVLGPPSDKASVTQVEEESERNAVDSLVKARAVLTVVILRLAAHDDLATTDEDSWPLESLTTLLVSFLTLKDEATLLTTLEALAYVTLSPSEKTAPLKSLVSPSSILSLPTQLPSLAYPLSTLLLNLCAFPPHSLLQLPTTPDTKLEPKESINSRISLFVRHSSFVPTVVRLAQSPSSSESTKKNIAKLLLNVAEEKPNRPPLVQGGVPKSLLFLISTITSSPSLEAIQALAKLLITTDPSLIFTPAILPSAAKVLIIPLSLPPSTATDEGPHLLLQFECLLALTNIASCSEEISSYISSLSLTSSTPPKPFLSLLVTEHLLSSNLLIRRATTELICNLSSTPSCLSFFASPSTANNPLSLLLALLSSQDLATRLACSGALATLAACSVDIAKSLPLDKLLDYVEGDEDEEEDEDVRERIWAAVFEIVTSNGGVVGDDKVRKRVVNLTGKEVGRLKDLAQEIFQALK